MKEKGSQMTDRRTFLKMSAAGVAAISFNSCTQSNPVNTFDSLTKMTNDVVPIRDEERWERIRKAQKLMEQNKIQAVFMEPGSSSFYFADFNTWVSERMIAMVLPAKGDPVWICPKFEEDRMREIIRFGKEFRTWEEDESPYKLAAGLFKDLGIGTGLVGIEERVRFFLMDGIRQEATGIDLVSAVPVTAGCRMFKSPAEIALLKKSNEITVAAYKATVATLKEGMTPDDFAANCTAAFVALGVKGGAGANFGKASALPHGSLEPQKLREGDIVLMDGGCKVEGYQSDISRTVVFGKPTQRQRDIWELAKRAQTAALNSVKVGVPCEQVDAVARKVITDAGFGPDYKLPGLPHRTGHGIGLDYHEWTNFVRGNKTLIAPGMCFSDEPMVAIPGEFGVRLEDCLYITADGGKLFTEQSPSIDQPFL